MKSFAVLTIWIGVSQAGLRGANPPEFQRDIRPILTEFCFQCHGPDAGKRQAGLRLDRRESAVARLESGETAIQPANPNSSALLRRIESSDPEVVMPPPETKRQLSIEQKQLLRRWIESGAVYSEHWAYLAPTRPLVPATQDTTWSRNSIDQFVLAKLESLQLRPSPPADPTTLIRRLSLDLTGLPPTMDDIDTFLADRDAGAYERVVDRILSSPHFGERLAQDWLDLARFGDSSGYQDDGDRPNYPFRDYVIAAFNANMPFDQFTVENLAGDLLPDATLMQRVASGFNRLHRHNEEGGSDPDEFQVVYTVDRTNTVATTWMGITFGCAQCHDHKYDPFTQREFYQLYAFFNSLKGEVVISKSASPPQIRVPAPEHRARFDRLVREIAEVERQQNSVQSESTAKFASWLKEQQGTEIASAPPTSNIKTGAIGGTVARTTHAAWYGDARLESPLAFTQPIHARGRISVTRSVNNLFDVGHFSAQDLQRGSIGFTVAEGPRFFANLLLPDGTRIAPEPIRGEHGVEYTWSYRFDPVGGSDDPADADQVGEGLLTFELNKDEKRIGTATIDLTSVQRASAISFDAFGISYRGASDDNAPIECLLDDVEYLASNGGVTRQQAFDRDPDWTGSGNTFFGHQFGFDPAATTSLGVLSFEQILALPANQRTRSQIGVLREKFLAGKFPELDVLNKRQATLRQQRDAVEKGFPLALVWEEMESPRPARLLARGDYQQPRDVVPRGTPAIFPPLDDNATRSRLELAKWLVDGRHPLTARVAVNRLWKQCFGAGLVRTSEDFGIRGDSPTHPELLDWLAVEFSSPQAGSNSISATWDIKRLLRFIVTSSTYRQSSVVNSHLREIDPDNRLLARGARFRLTAEEIRDAALMASGLLTRQIGGRSVYPYQPDYFYRDKEDDPGEWKWPVETGDQLYRRGLYTFLRRTTPYPPYQAFDAPSRGECTVSRSRTNTPLQAMVTMNDPAFVEAARVLGEWIAMFDGDNNARMKFAFRNVLSRPPSDREQAIAQRLLQSELDRYRGDPASAAQFIGHGKAPRMSAADPIQVAAWTAVATALLNLDEAITRE